MNLFSNTFNQSYQLWWCLTDQSLGHETITFASHQSQHCLFMPLSAILFVYACPCFVTC